MKRLGSSDTLGGLMSMCPTTDEQSPRKHVYSREFQTMLEEEGCVEESGHVAEKKRRLSVDQVKALEKNFEVENKLEPERKVKLAQELGLQPRQVAVWFQNRRARWKTKQLERDYGLLKANYDALKANYDALHHDNEALLKEIKELKSKLSEENTESNVSVKEEVILPESDDDKPPDHPQPAVLASETKQFLNFENRNNSSNSSSSGLLLSAETSLLVDLKDGSSDSDSSAILNEENANNNSPINEFILSPPPGKTTTSSSTSLPKFNCSSSLLPCFQFSRASATATTTTSMATTFQAQLVKMEEHNFFTSEDACNFFSDEQPPTLQWCCPDQWN